MRSGGFWVSPPPFPSPAPAQPQLSPMRGEGGASWVRGAGWGDCPWDRAVKPRVPEERGIWPRRLWERQIREGGDFAAHLRYCWGNPVKHGLGEKPEDWEYSSVHREIRMRRYGW